MLRHVVPRKEDAIAVPPSEPLATLILLGRDHLVKIILRAPD
jgi:hypothetical protein